ncbi:hypothetical protein C8R46DRAFT_1294880 [Mycena filopes]|nr:hypothetical protein C8R46DRAFT_1294880 [Mycena filopes]
MDVASPNKDTDGANGSDLNAPSITAAEVPVGNAGPATPVVLPSHARSMVGQTAPSFARTQDDGVEAVPVVTGPVITAPVVIDEAASHAATTPKKKGKGRASTRAKAASQRAAGKGPEKEKVARKGSYKHAAESLEQATKKTDQLLTSMSNRINSVKSTAETSAHELATLRDKLARLERRIDGILAVRADDAARADVVDDYDTGSESGGAQKRKAASSAGSRSPKRGRWETRGRSSEKGSRAGSTRSRSTDRVSNREGSFRGDNDDEYEDGGERSESEDWDDSGTESEGGRRSVGERLAAEKRSLQDRLQSPEGGQDGRDDGRGHSAWRERTRSASPRVRSRRAEKRVGRAKRRRSSSPPGPPSAAPSRAQDVGGNTSQPRAPMNWGTPFAVSRGGFNGRGGFNTGFNGGPRGGRGGYGQHGDFGQRGGFNGGFNNALAGPSRLPAHSHQPSFAVTAHRPPPEAAFPPLTAAVRLGPGAWTERRTFEDVCKYIAFIKASGLGPVPQPKTIGEPGGRRNRYVVATFANRHEAGTFKALWNRWCENNEKWKKMKAVFADD